MGLFLAMESWDPTRSQDFKTFATGHIRNKMLNYRHKHSTILTVPGNVSKGHYNLKRLINAYLKEGLDWEESFQRAMKSDDPEDNEERRKIRSYIHNLAQNAHQSYEKFTGLAALLLGREEVPFELVMQVPAPQMKEHLLLPKDLSPMQRRALELRLDGLVYREIAEQLYEEGFSSQVASRQAIAQLLRNAEKRCQELMTYQDMP